MNHSAPIRRRSFGATGVNALLIDTEVAKDFSRRAFVAITLSLVVAWFVTG